MSNIPKPVYVMSEPHLSGYRVILGYNTLEDASQAHDAAVNALPELLERVKRLEADLQVIAFGWRYVAEPDNSFTKVDWTRDQLIEYARAALKETGQ